MLYFLLSLLKNKISNNILGDWYKIFTIHAKPSKVSTFFSILQMRKLPWLVWLSGLSASLWTKGSPVGFPVRAHGWVVDQVPSRGHLRSNHTMMFLSLSFSLPSPLSENTYIKSLKKNKATWLNRLSFPSQVAKIAQANCRLEGATSVNAGQITPQLSFE